MPRKKSAALKIGSKTERMYRAAAYKSEVMSADAARVLYATDNSVIRALVCERWENLPEDVQAALGSDTAVDVRARWLSRKDTPLEVILDALKNEKRPSVLNVILEQEHVAPEALAAMSTSTHPSVLMSVIHHPSTPEPARAQAIVTLLTGRAQRPATQSEVAKTLPLIALTPSCHERVALTATDPAVLREVISPALSGEAVARVAKRVVLDRQAHGFTESVSEVSAAPLLTAALALFEHEGLPEELRPALADATYELEQKIYEANTYRVDTQAIWRTFAHMGPYLTDPFNQKRYHALLHDLEVLEAIEMCRDPETLSEYARTHILERANWPTPLPGWGKPPLRRGPSGFLDTVVHHATALVMNPALRVDDMMKVCDGLRGIWHFSTVLDNRYPDPITDEQAEEIHVLFRQNAFTHSVYMAQVQVETLPSVERFRARPDWMRIYEAVVTLNETDPDRQRASLGTVANIFGPLPVELFPRLLLETCLVLPETFEYLMGQFGTDLTRWEIFESLAQNFEGTLADIATAVNELV